MKVAIVNSQSGVRKDFDSVFWLKRYCSSRPFWSGSLLRVWQVYRLSSDGKLMPYRFGIKSLYDFISHYNV